MKEVKSINEINFANSEEISFLATIESVERRSTDKPANVPTNISLRFELTGKRFDAIAWKLDDTLLPAEKDGNIYYFSAVGNVFNGKSQVKINSLKSTGKKSSYVPKTRKLSKNGIDELKKNISDTIETIKNDFLRDMTKHFVLDDPKYFTWPAATSIHHAFPGGLAKHSYSVCQIALKTFEVYNGENMNRDLIIAGSLLHDIGKLEEYEEDGKRTIIGDMIGHPVLGENKIIEYAHNNKNITESNLLLSLCHIILSHHGKLEFGSPVIPSTLEARIISSADLEDANVEIFLNKMTTMEENSESEKLLPLDGKVIYLNTEE